MKIKNRLSVQIAVAVGLIALFGTLVVSFISYLTIQSNELLESRRVLHQLGLTVARNASIAAYLDNQEIASDTILGLMNNELVAAVALTSLTGLSATEGQPKQRPAAEAVQLALDSPFREGERVGDLTIFPHQDLIALNARHAAMSQAVLLGGYTLTVALLVMLIIQWQFVPPLRQVAAALHQIAPGSHERLVPPLRHDEDEIGNLVFDINQLLSLVQDRLDSERALREEIQSLEQRFRLIFERASVGIILVNDQGQLMMSNQAFRGILDQQCEPGEQDCCIHQLFEDTAMARQLLEQAVGDGESVGADLVLAGDDPHAPRWVHCLFTRIGSTNHTFCGQILVQGIITDITERKRTEALMRQLAERDPLTNLLNRRSIQQGLRTLLEHSERARSCIAVCLIDLDDFKSINDTYGHEAGDQVLITVAQRMRELLRRGDLVARLGGDEFLVAIPDSASKSAVSAIATKLLCSLTQDIELQPGLSVRVGASIGIALSGEHGTDASRLLAIADQAMYRVKHSGKSDFQIL